MIDFKRPPLHPTDEELAHFISGKIIGTRKKEIEEHLVYCDDCLDVLVEVKKREENNFIINTFLYMNNLFYNRRVRAVVLSGMVASMALFFIMPTEKKQPLFIDFYTSSTQGTFLSAEKIEIKDIKVANQDLNNFLKTLTQNTDMSYLKEYKEAKKYLKKGDFHNARESYGMVLIEIEDSDLNKIEKAKQSIFVNYQILLLSIKEGNEESASEYKDVIRDDIRRLRIREKNKSL